MKLGAPWVVAVGPAPCPTPLGGMAVKNWGGSSWRRTCPRSKEEGEKEWDHDTGAFWGTRAPGPEGRSQCEGEVTRRKC